MVHRYPVPELSDPVNGIVGGAATLSTNNERYFIRPGTTGAFAVTLSGDRVSLRVGAGSVLGVVTLSGDQCQLICENGVDMTGLVVSGDFAYVDGGGWNTISDGGTTRHACNISGTDAIIKNMAFDTTGGGGQSYDGVVSTATRTVLDTIKLIDSDSSGINFNTGATNGLLTNSTLLSADAAVVRVAASTVRVLNNHVIGAGTNEYNIDVTGNGDNATIVGNVAQDSTTAENGIVLRAGGDNSLCVGNRSDGAVTDASTGSTVASNEETMF